MTKHRPDGDRVANELMGASAFFRKTPPEPPVTPPPVVTPVVAPLTPEPLPNNAVVTSRRHDAVTSSGSVSSAFDINRETSSRDSLRLATDETKAVEALRSALKWDHDLAVSKNDICRVALHALLEDFTAKGERSQAIHRLKAKKTGR
ncbi:MAG: hypothetical protein ACR2OU_06745 [Thermomicrobiales bacterium]